MESLIRDFKVLEAYILQSATTSMALNDLKTLPKALVNCSKLLKASPNLKALGKSMSSLKSDLGNAKSSIKELRNELLKEKNPLINKFLDINVGDVEFKNKIEAEKKAREARLTAKANKTQPSVVASIDDITRMIDEENKKQ